MRQDVAKFCMGRTIQRSGGRRRLLLDADVVADCRWWPQGRLEPYKRSERRGANEQTRFDWLPLPIVILSLYMASICDIINSHKEALWTRKTNNTHTHTHLYIYIYIYIYILLGRIKLVCGSTIALRSTGQRIIMQIMLFVHSIANICTWNWWSSTEYI